MKKNERHSILARNRKNLRQYQKNFLVLVFLVFVMAAYFSWNLKQVQKENVEVKNLVFELEKNQLNEQNSIYKMCLAEDERAREVYAGYSNDFDMQIQNQIKELRKLLPDEKELLNEVQELLQNALPDRQRAIRYARSEQEGKSALQILNHEYTPKLQQISELCQQLSTNINESSRSRIVKMEIGVFSLLAFIIIATVILIFITGRRQKKIDDAIRIPLKEIVYAMEQLEQGNLSYESSYHAEDEMGMLTESIRNTMRTLCNYIENIQNVLLALSKKEYYIENHCRYTGDFVRISEALDCIIEELNITMSGISADLSKVESAGSHVKKSAQNLAKDSSESAALVADFSSSLDKLVEQVEKNRDRMTEVNKGEKEITVWIENGWEEIKELQKLMEENANSTKELQSFMKNMDELSEEINLLSLNVSIEAAKVGAEGKGFAVIAEQIRHLSEQTVLVTGKSKEYIEKYAVTARIGMEQANHTRERMDQIAKQVHRIGDMVQETSNISNAQLNRMQLFKNGILDMSEIVQKGSVMATNLEQQSIDLQETVKMICHKVHEFQLKQSYVG